jgi:hypothetical protein
MFRLLTHDIFYRVKPVAAPQQSFQEKLFSTSGGVQAGTGNLKPDGRADEVPVLLE